MRGRFDRRTRSRRLFLFHRKADVIFRETPGRCPRTGYVVEFGELAALVERIFIRKAMQHRSHPPRESLHFPDAPQADIRIGIEQVAAASVIKVLESPRQYSNVANRQI